LGKAFLNIGLHEIALELFNESLKINNSHPDLAMIQCEIAAALINNRRYVESLSFLEKSLEIQKNKFKDKPYNPDLAQTYLHISNAFAGNEEFVKSLDYSLKSLEINEKIYENNTKHPNLAVCYGYVSLAYFNMVKKHYKNADENEKTRDYLLKYVDYSEKSIEIFNESCVNGHPYLKILKGICEKQLEYSLELFKIYETVYKDNRGHPDVINACCLILSSVRNIVKMNMPNWKKQTWQALLKAIDNAHASF
jgi:tetratricopeptide (TPR) repeat protein